MLQFWERAENMRYLCSKWHRCLNAAMCVFRHCVRPSASASLRRRRRVRMYVIVYANRYCYCTECEQSGGAAIVCYSEAAAHGAQTISGHPAARRAETAKLFRKTPRLYDCWSFGSHKISMMRTTRRRRHEMSTTTTATRSNLVAQSPTLAL